MRPDGGAQYPSKPYRRPGAARARPRTAARTGGPREAWGHEESVQRQRSACRVNRVGRFVHSRCAFQRHGQTAL